MTKLLELRDGIRSFYGRFEIYIRPGLRFVVALVAFLTINSGLGYMRKIDNPAIPIALALVCTFLPVNATVVLAALLILAHLFALSVEVCAIALLLLLLMFFMYFKFAPKEGFGVLLTPLLRRFGIGEVMPTVLGLGRGPHSVLSMVCGMVLYHFLKGVKANETLFAAVEEDAEVSKFTVALDQIVGNEELYIAAAAFAATALVIYILRRQAFTHSWTVAVGVGNGINLIVLIAGNFMVKGSDSILRMVLGTLAAVAVGLVMEFFLFHLDYSRTEHVQFEDDEYYYYVKAIPKVFVLGKEKQVKQINSRKHGGINKKELADEFDIDQDLLND